MAPPRHDIYEHCVWLNPVPEEHWGWTPLIKMIRDTVGRRIFPLTPEGLGNEGVDEVGAANAGSLAGVRSNSFFSGRET